MKILVIILFSFLLTSFAPVPKAQQCSVQDARQFGTYLRQIVYDPTGVPYGEVAAWTCGNAEGAITELRSRIAEMQAQAATYRAEHPIK